MRGEPFRPNGVIQGMKRQLRVKTRLGIVCLAGIGLVNSGCASLVASAAGGFADNLSVAVLNQNDPDTVRDGAPAYLLLLDSLVEGSPDNPEILSAAANLYASYGAIFAGDADRAARLTARAREYGERALCESYARSCGWKDMSYEQFESSLDGLKAKHAEHVLSYSVSSLAYIRAHSSDWNALAELPQMEALLNRYLEISGSDTEATVHTYLGILTTLRPPALGGEPEKGRRHFEEAIKLSGGRDLSTKVEYARGYARLMYERELHDRLLNEVIGANPQVPGLTLTNVLAQQDALSLLQSADDYF